MDDAPIPGLAETATDGDKQDALQDGFNDTPNGNGDIAVPADIPALTAPTSTATLTPADQAASVPITSEPAASTLNANTINADKEQEHIDNAEKLGQIEDAILEADEARKEVAELEDATAASISKTIKEEKMEEAHALPLPETDITTSKSSAPASMELTVDPAFAGPHIDDSEIPASATFSAARHHGEDEEEQDIVPEPSTSSNGRQKPRSASAASSSTVPRPQRRNRKEDKEPTPSTSSRVSSRRAKDAASSEKPLSTSGKDRDGSVSATAGGTARTRGLAQRQADKADREKEKGKGRRNGSSGRPKIGKRSSNVSLNAAGDEMDIDGEDGEANGAEDDGDEGVTRCICGNNDDEAPGFMIQCDTCRAWQHGPCVGFKDESKCPDTYFCEQCRPELHPSLTPSSSRSGVGIGGASKKHARSVSASSRSQVQQHQRKHSRANSHDAGPLARETTAAKEIATASIREASRAASRPPNSRDRDSSASVPPLPASTTSSSHPSHQHLPSHRSRASADASVITSFMAEQNQNQNTKQRTSQASASPSPGSPGSAPNSASSHGPMAADGKRPMYPATSHLSAPAQPKRRSTMNSRESAAFDESIMMANANAFKESRLMAAVVGGGGGGGTGSGSGTGSGYGSEGSNGNNASANPNKRKRRKRDDSEELEREDSMTMEAVKEEDEEDEDARDGLGSLERPNGKRLKRDTQGQQSEEEGGIEHDEKENRQQPEEHTLPPDVTQAANEHIEQSEMAQDEDGEFVHDPLADESLQPKKRRRRRGPGATAPVRKKTPAKPRSKASSLANGGQPLTEGEETEEPETPIQAEAPTFLPFSNGEHVEGTPVPEANAPTATTLIPTSANRSSRKRKNFAVDEDAPPVPASNAVKAASPTASVVTTESSHSSLDKPLAIHAGKQKPKTSTSILPDPSNAVLAGPDTILASAPVADVDGPVATDSLVLPLSANASEAPSPAGSATTTATAVRASGEVNGTGKGGLMPPTALPRGKRGVKNQQTAEETEEEEDGERSGTPGPLGAFSSGLGRGKHPNQYTYRGGSRGGGPGSRGGTKTSPNKRAAMNAAAAEAARRGYRDRDETPGAYDDLAVQPPTWGLPDHLAHLYHLLPSQNPAPLGVPTYTYTPQASNASSPTQAMASQPVAAEPLSASSSVASSSSSSAQSLPAATRHLEPATKVRFPPRRVSLTEMRKRAKHVLEYMGRVQMDMVDRNNRNRALGLLQSSMVTAPDTAPSGSKQDLSQTPQSAVLMDNLSRQLINFQEKYM